MARTLFERYGGFATVSKIVLSFYGRVLDDDILAPYFDDVDMRRLIDHQTKFVSQVMGGPATYTNESLRQLHAHLAITDEAFDVMIDVMEETLEDFDFADSDLDAVVTDLESRRSWIVAGAGE